MTIGMYLLIILVGFALGWGAATYETHLWEKHYNKDHEKRE